ncbi:MAG: hypothetical protein AAB686_02960 [Patescibacteria group bacterium]
MGFETAGHFSARKSEEKKIQDEAIAQGKDPHEALEKFRARIKLANERLKHEKEQRALQAPRYNLSPRRDKKEAA